VIDLFADGCPHQLSFWSQAKNQAFDEHALVHLGSLTAIGCRQMVSMAGCTQSTRQRVAVIDHLLIHDDVWHVVSVW